MPTLASGLKKKQDVGISLNRGQCGWRMTDNQQMHRSIDSLPKQ